MLTPQQAEKLKSNPEWKALEEHIRECVDTLDHCSLIPDDDDHDKAARGRKYAVQIIQNILEPFSMDVVPNQDKRKEALKKLGLN